MSDRFLDSSPEINELAAALGKAQGQMKHAVMDRSNPYFKTRYATLASIWEAIRVPLSANGLAVIQSPLAEGGGYGVETVLVHSSGQWKRSLLLLRPVKDDPQGAGSCLTYARRYSLAAMVGAVADEDDDAESAVVHTGGQTPPRRSQEPPIEVQSQEVGGLPQGQGLPAPTPPAVKGPYDGFKPEVREILVLRDTAGLSPDAFAKLSKETVGIGDVHRMTPEQRETIKEVLVKLFTVRGT